MKARKRRSDAVVSEILLEQLAVVRANLDAAAGGGDPDALHDLRVAVRRSRAVLKGMPGVFAPADLDSLKADLKELQNLTGPVRDYDVLLDEIDAFADERPELEPEIRALHAEFAKRRRIAQTRLARRLRSKRQAAELAAWERVAAGLPTDGDDERPDAATPIARLAGARIGTDHQRFLELAGAALESHDPPAVHHTRKRGKALRYNLEFYGDLVDKDRARSLRRHLKAAQDELGAYQDTIVREAELRSAAEADPAVALAAGAMLDRSLDERADSLAHFEKRYRRLSKPKRVAGVRAAFRG